VGFPCALAAAQGQNRKTSGGGPQGPPRDPGWAGHQLPVARYAPLIWRRSDGLAAVSGTPGEGGLAQDPVSPCGLGVYAGEGEGGGGGG